MHYLILPMLLSLIVWSLFVVKAFHKYETAAKRDADRRLKKQNQVAAAATAAATATTATAATAAVADTTDAADTAAAAATTATTMIAASAASQSELKGNWKGLLSSRVLSASPNILPLPSTHIYLLSDRDEVYGFMMKVSVGSVVK